MSDLRRECYTYTGPKDALSRHASLLLLREALLNKKGLIAGRLRDAKGQTCAIGALWDSNPEAVIKSSVFNEIAIINDSLPPRTSRASRLEFVRKWVEKKILALADA
jgi:hypothetical protein